MLLSLRYPNRQREPQHRSKSKNSAVLLQSAAILVLINTSAFRVVFFFDSYATRACVVLPVLRMLLLLLVLRMLLVLVVLLV